MQRCRTSKVETEWAMVLRFSGDQGLHRTGQDPHEAHRHRRHQGHEPWFGQEYSIYSPAQLEEFARFQESQGTRLAFLAETPDPSLPQRIRPSHTGSVPRTPDPSLAHRIRPSHTGSVPPTPDPSLANWYKKAAAAREARRPAYRATAVPCGPPPADLAELAEKFRAAAARGRTSDVQPPGLACSIDDSFATANLSNSSILDSDYHDNSKILVPVSIFTASSMAMCKHFHRQKNGQVGCRVYPFSPPVVWLYRV
jgi:hypothetical protein